jgi:hypothetical protein
MSVEYFEIMPSVKAITAKSLGTFKPILLAVFASYRKSSFTAKRHQWLYLVIIVQLLFRRYQRLRF